ncbi:hypothetical protein [Paenibacillus sp. OAS669]|uniref:hypothetical protein n=1 Tax=Paenibacillus sp. OAS669 TaxID=2663821 RepID=UPI00178ADA56|nr:hypothetical protein [Paenibacillus sp. OAS669]MBE1446897.1 hypothetical protein [Paenibacillus sp. OAS669]
MDEGWGLPAGAGIGATSLPVKDKPVFGGAIFAAGVGESGGGTSRSGDCPSFARSKKQTPLDTSA